MPRYNQQQIDAQYQKLPPILRQAMLSADIAEKMFDMGTQAGLTIEEIGLMAEETSYIILGLTQPSVFVDSLANRLKLDPDRAQAIAREINTNILMPLREALQSAHHIDIERVFSQAQTPAPAADTAHPTLRQTLERTMPQPQPVVAQPRLQQPNNRRIEIEQQRQAPAPQHSSTQPPAFSRAPDKTNAQDSPSPYQESGATNLNLNEARELAGDLYAITDQANQRVLSLIQQELQKIRAQEEEQREAIRGEIKSIAAALNEALRAKIKEDTRSTITEQVSAAEAASNQRMQDLARQIEELKTKTPIPTPSVDADAVRRIAQDLDQEAAAPLREEMKTIANRSSQRMLAAIREELSRTRNQDPRGQDQKTRDRKHLKPETARRAPPISAPEPLDNNEARAPAPPPTQKEKPQPAPRAPESPERPMQLPRILHDRPSKIPPVDLRNKPRIPSDTAPPPQESRPPATPSPAARTPAPAPGQKPQSPIQEHVYPGFDPYQEQIG